MDGRWRPGAGGGEGDPTLDKEDDELVGINGGASARSLKVFGIGKESRLTSYYRFTNRRKSRKLTNLFNLFHFPGSSTRRGIFQKLIRIG